VHDEHHDKHERPANKSTDSSPNLVPVKDEIPDEQRPEDLRGPVDKLFNPRARMVNIAPL
jgi:hypothetical protein